MSTAPVETITGDVKRLYSYDELCEIMEETNQPHELWDGELIVAPAPFFEHQKIVLRFYRLLFDWVEAGSLGEVITSPMDMVLSPHRSVQPDVIFVARENLKIIQGVIRGAADLVAEVVSPGGRHRDRVDKKDLYEQHGIKEYWIIDPEARTVDVLALQARQFQLTGRYLPGEVARSVLLPGFEFPVDSLFAGLAG